MTGPVFAARLRRTLSNSFGEPLAHVGRSRQARLFMAANVIDAFGTGLFLVGAALFFTRALGLSAAQVGIGLTASGIAGMLGAVPLGRLADRVGGRRVLAGLQLWRGLCFAAYPFAHGFGVFLLVACLLGAGEWAVAPVSQGVVGVLSDAAGRVGVMAAMTAVRNLGFAAGALAATSALAVDSAAVYRALVFADAATFLASAAMLARLRMPEPAAARGRAASRRPRPRPGARYRLLALCNGVLYLHTVMLAVALPLWIVDDTRAPRVMVGGIVLLNTILALVLQLPLSRGSDRVAGAALRQAWAGAALGLTCLLAAAAAWLSPVLAVAVLGVSAAGLTAGEVLQSVGGWGVSYALAPERDRTYYLSVYSLGASAATVVGPALFTVVVFHVGTAGWALVALAFLLAGAAVPLIARPAVPGPESADQVSVAELETVA